MADVKEWFSYNTKVKEQFVFSWLVMYGTDWVTTDKMFETHVTPFVWKDLEEIGVLEYQYQFREYDLFRLTPMVLDYMQTFMQTLQENQNGTA